MAKSLRSKTKRAFRKIKREDPKSDYHIRDKLRLQRLNEKLKVLTPVSDDDDEDDVEDETVAQPAASSSMQEDSSNSKQGDSKAGPSTSTSTSTMQTEETEPPKKISTGGPRQSANLEWRKKVGMGPKKRTSANSTTFTKPKNYKSPGRARRARN